MAPNTRFQTSTMSEMRAEIKKLRKDFIGSQSTRPVTVERITPVGNFPLNPIVGQNVIDQNNTQWVYGFDATWHELGGIKEITSVDGSINPDASTPSVVDLSIANIHTGFFTGFLTSQDPTNNPGDDYATVTAGAIPIVWNSSVYGQFPSDMFSVDTGVPQIGINGSYLMLLQANVSNVINDPGVQTWDRAYSLKLGMTNIHNSFGLWGTDFFHSSDGAGKVIASAIGGYNGVTGSTPGTIGVNFAYYDVGLGTQSFYFSMAIMRISANGHSYPS